MFHTDLNDNDLRNTFSTVCKELKIPMPQPDHHHDGHGRPVFLNPFGAVLRIQLNSLLPIIRLPHILRPIGAIHLTTKYRLDIQPARGPSNISTAERDKASAAIRNHTNFEITDSATFNFFRAKTTSEQFPLGIPLNFDPAQIRMLPSASEQAVDCLNEKKRVLDLLPKSNEDIDHQDQEFGHLTKAFQNAYNPITQTFDPDRIIDFWKLMAQSVENETLIPDWKNTDHNKPGIQQMAQSYEALLRENCPFIS